MTDKNAGHFEILTGYPADVVAISAIGHIDHATYEETLIPALEAAISREGKVKVLYLIGAEFKGFSAGAIFEDAKYGLTHLAEFAQVAVVSDVDWIRATIKLVAPFLHQKLRLFSITDMEAAKDWITRYHPLADDNTPEVAAKKIAPAADDLA